MSNRNLVLLLVAAVVLAALTGLLYTGEEGPEREFESGRPLVQGLPFDSIQSIKIKSGDNSVSLRRSGDSFVLANKDGYPASTQKVNNLLTGISDIRLERKITESPDNYADLGVSKDSPDGTTVTFYDSSQKKMFSLIKGSNAQNSPGAYVRRAGRDPVFLTQQRLTVNSTPLDYVDKSLMSLSEDSMQQVAVKLKDSSYTLKREDDGGIALQNVPEGKKSTQSAIDSTFSALTNVRLSDIVKAESLDVKWDGQYTCRLKNGLTYRLQTAEKDGTYYAKLSAEADTSGGDETGDSSGGKVEKQQSEEQSTNPAKKASAFNQKHKGWAYELAEWQASKLRKPLSELVEAKTPDKISARQILISHKEARESTSDRSKKEARQLARKLHNQLTEQNASFAELAKKHSDGPNADSGGKLGTVKKGSRNETFEEAAFKLKTGDISDVVETPRGFHIIKRTDTNEEQKEE